MSVEVLYVRVLGLPEVSWQGAPLPGLRRKAVLLVCWLAVRGRPAPRDELATLLWGAGRLANLRQELKALRACPGAELWLKEEGRQVGLRAATDLDEVRAALDRGDVQAASALDRGSFLEGVDDGGLVGLGDWLDTQAALVEELRAVRDRLVARDRAPVAQEAVERMMASAGEPVPVAVLARALELPTWAVLEAQAAAAARRRPAPPPDPSLRQALARAWRAHEGPSAATASRLMRADLPVEAAETWLSLARTGELAAAEAAAALPVPPLLRGEALRRAAELSNRRGQAERFRAHIAALRALARDTQLPALLLEAALLDARACLLAGDRDGATRWAREAEALAARHGQEADRARAALWVGHATGDEAALLLAAQGSDEGAAVAALAALGALDARRGDVATAAARHRDALARVRELQDRDSAARMLNNLGATAERAGDLAEALRCFQDAAALALALDDAALLATSRLNLAEASRRTGALGECRAQLGALLSGPPTSPRHQAAAWQVRGDLEATCGRTLEAERWATRAAEAWERAGDPAAAALARFNAALAAGAPFDALVEAIERLPQADLAALAWSELALVAPDRERCELALARGRLDPVRACVARLRHERVDASALHAVPDELASVEVTLGLLSLGGQTERERAERLLERHCQGLLTAQASALRERYRRYQRSRPAASSSPSP